MFAESTGRVQERDAIYQRVWGYAMAHSDRSVDVFVRKLRHKLEKRSPGWTYIHTHFGVGYRFDPEPLGQAVAGGDRSALISALLHVLKNVERIGDNAVDIGEQVAFVVTGLFKKFEDASHPG